MASEDKKSVVKGLLEKGKKKGMLSYQEITDALEEIDLDPKQIEKVYESLESMGIEIVGDIEREMEEIQIEEEDLDLSIPEGVSVEDHVRMYLKEIGKVPLLDH